MRSCGQCGHTELIHYQGKCYFELHPEAPDSDRPCRCGDDREARRGQIGSHEVLDEYSAIKEHLGRIMEKEANR